MRNPNSCLCVHTNEFPRSSPRCLKTHTESVGIRKQSTTLADSVLRHLVSTNLEEAFFNHLLIYTKALVDHMKPLIHRLHAACAFTNTTLNLIGKATSPYCEGCGALELQGLDQVGSHECARESHWAIVKPLHTVKEILFCDGTFSWKYSAAAFFHGFVILEVRSW